MKQTISRSLCWAILLCVGSFFAVEAIAKPIDFAELDRVGA